MNRYIKIMKICTPHVSQFVFISDMGIIRCFPIFIGQHNSHIKIKPFIFFEEIFAFKL